MAKTGCLVLLLVWGELCASGYPAEDGPQGAEASSVSNRLDNLEGIVLQLQGKNAHQENQLRKQEEKLSRQQRLLGKQQSLLGQFESQLRQQNAELSRQHSALRHQEELLRHQGSLLRQQEAKLSQQAQMLSHYSHLSEGLKDWKSTPYTSSSSKFVTNTTSELHDVRSRSVTRDGCPESCSTVIDGLSQHVVQMEANIQALKNSDSQQNLHIHNNQGSTFVRWGYSYCGNTSELIYAGVMGGAPYNHPGGATNFLCLTLDPVFSSMDAPSEKAVLYGAQYDTDNSVDGYDPVCSVCRSTFSTTVMIPGTNVCTPGWHLLYSGFLMAGDFTKTSGSQFICVDDILESRVGSGDDRMGKLVTYTVTQCLSSLPCGPYQNHKVVTCVVCGK